MMTLKRLVPVLVLLSFVGVACGSDDNPSIDGASQAADHNDADVEFAKGMIPHHRQAVEMADLATTRASDPKVKDLAARIKKAQEPEIATMTGWLEDWGEKVPAEGADDGEMDMEMGTSGMMSQEEMGELEKASGQGFDRLFLTMMIRHHESAIAMAETEVEKGRFPPAQGLAAKITSSQRAEIDEMKSLLATPKQ